MFSAVYPQLGVLFLLVSDRNIRSVGLGYPHWRKEDVLCLSQSAKQGFAGLGNGEHCNGSILSTLSPVRSLALLRVLLVAAAMMLAPFRSGSEPVLSLHSFVQVANTT